MRLNLICILLCVFKRDALQSPLFIHGVYITDYVRTGIDAKMLVDEEGNRSQSGYDLTRRGETRRDERDMEMDIQTLTILLN